MRLLASPLRARLVTQLLMECTRDSADLPPDPELLWQLPLGRRLAALQDLLAGDDEG